jgi:fluoroquinolone transport system permease protein
MLRYGLVAAAALVAALVGLGLSALRLAEPGALLPAALANNLILGAYYVAGGLMLLERAEGSLAARAVTPLGWREYLLARLAALALLNLGEGLAIALLAAGPRLALLPLAAGLCLATTAFGLAGVAAAARFSSLNAFLLPSLLYIALLAAPVLADMAGWYHPLLLLHPLQGPLLLLRAAFAPADAWQLGASLLSTAGGLAWLWRAAARGSP